MENVGTGVCDGAALHRWQKGRNLILNIGRTLRPSTLSPRLLTGWRQVSTLCGNHLPPSVLECGHLGNPDLTDLAGHPRHRKTEIMPSPLNERLTLNFPKPFKALPKNLQQIQWVLNRLEFNQDINGNRIPPRFREYRRNVLENLRKINVLSLTKDCIKDLSNPLELDIFLDIAPRSNKDSHRCVDQALELCGLQNNIGNAFPANEKYTWELPYVLENILGCTPFGSRTLTPYVSWRRLAEGNAKHLVAFFTKLPSPMTRNQQLPGAIPDPSASSPNVIRQKTNVIRQESPGNGHMMLVTKGADGIISFIDKQNKSRENRNKDYVLAWKIPNSNGTAPPGSVVHDE